MRASIPKRLRTRFLAEPDRIERTSDYCRRRGLSFARVSPAVETRRCLPDTPEPSLHWKFLDPGERVHAHPETWVAQLPGARVVTGDAHIVTRDGVLLEDASVQLGLTDPEAHTLLTDHLVVPRRQALPGTATVLSSADADGYYHWLLDALPRLGILEGAGIDLEHIDHFLVPRGRLPAIRESLELLGVPLSRCRELDTRSSPVVDKLLLPSLPGRTGNTAPWARDYLRDRFLPAALALPDRFPRRFFVSRRGGRRVANEAALMPVLEHFNIEPVQPETLGFLEQVALFARAELIVAPHGAALANLVFSPPSTAVVELFSPAYVNVCFWALAQLGGLRYAYLEGEGERPPPGVDPHAVRADLAVSPGRLSDWLRTWA